MTMDKTTAVKKSYKNIIPQKVLTEHRERAALSYAIKLNWAVIPLHSVNRGRCTCGRSDCTSPGKHPLTQKGVLDATTDINIIRKWWAKWPWANIGIACGKASNIVVLDIDGPEGSESLDELETAYGPLPETVEQITGGGGRHILFTYPKNIDYISPKVAIRRGIDIRADNSYIVVSPSVHLNGRHYVWEVEHHPLDRPLASLPTWLLHLIAKPQNELLQRKPLTYWATLLQNNIPEGQRNTRLTEYAGHLLGHGLGGMETLRLIQFINAAICVPPLPENEVIAIVNSIAGKQLDKLERNTQNND